MHDCKGRELKVGDTVMVPFKVEQITSTKDYCNVHLKSVAGMPPENSSHCFISAINTQQVLRANEGDDLTFTTHVDGNATIIK